MLIPLIHQISKRFFLYGIFIFFVNTPFSFPQTQSDEFSIRPPFTKGGTKGGFRYVESLKKDTVTAPKLKHKKFSMKKSPWLAVLQSAVVPGLGQIYNGSYWKTPIILGLSAYLGYQLYDNNKKYLDYRDKYRNSQNVFPPEGDLNLKVLREFYRDQRDEFIWYLTIVYVINLIDAYVDAHLFDFDVREEKLVNFRTSDKKLFLDFKIHF